LGRPVHDQLLDAHANWRARANQLSRTLKVSMMAGEYFIRQYRGHYYAKAQNLSRLLRKTYDQCVRAATSAADADDADEGDADPTAGCAAVALLPAGVRDAAEHRAVRRHRPPAMKRAVRTVGRAAGRHAAGRGALQRVDDLPRRPRVQSSSATGATSDGARPRANGPCRRTRSDPDWLAGGRAEQLKPHGTQSYVSGATDEPLRFITLPQLLAKTVGGTARATPRSSEAENLRLSWYDLQRKADELAVGLLALGLRRGNRVGIWAPNRHEWVVTQFATARIGSCSSTSIRRTAHRTRVRAEQGRLPALVMARRHKSSDYLGMLGEIAPEVHLHGASEVLDSARLPDLKHVVLLGDGPLPPHALSYRQLLALGGPAQRARLDALTGALDPDDAINIQFTSGTTGSPKGATLSHFNIVNNARYCAKAMALGPQDRLCIPVPLYHCFGMVLGVLCATASGARWSFRARASMPPTRCARSRATAAPRCTACRRCSPRCSRSPASRSTTCRPCAPASWPARHARSRRCARSLRRCICARSRSPTA
jgi:hypothetical protein